MTGTTSHTQEKSIKTKILSVRKGHMLPFELEHHINQKYILSNNQQDFCNFILPQILFRDDLLQTRSFSLYQDKSVSIPSFCLVPSQNWTLKVN